jgi:hypothetical protein
MEMAEHGMGGDQEDLEALPGCFVGNRLGQMRFARPRLAAEQEIAMGSDELAGGQIVDLLAIDGGVEAKVEALQRLGGVDAAAPDPEIEVLLGTTLDLILEEPTEPTLDELRRSLLLCGWFHGRFMHGLALRFHGRCVHRETVTTGGRSSLLHHSIPFAWSARRH